MAGGVHGGVGRGPGVRADTGEPGERSAVEADAGGQAGGAAYEYELLGVDELGQGRKDDDVELPGGAGSAGAVECGAAVSVSGGDGNSDTADGEYTEWSERA